MKKLRVVVAVMMVLLLTGCSAFTFEGSDIMCPPKATGNKAHIQKLIDKQTTGGYTLKYPKNGSNRSSIIMQDLDNDSVEEAVAFYSDKDSTDIHALFFKQDNEDYSIISDVVINATGIDSVEFADINGDKSSEILIGYKNAASSQNTLSVYDYDETITEFETACSYSSFITGDFNYDKRDDVLLISLYSGDIAAQAKLMVFNNNTLTEVSTAELDSDITQLANVSYSQVSYGYYAAIIDGVLSSGDYTTQVVLFDQSQPALLNPLFSYSGYNLTRRSTQICSLDFDKDELVDIPLCSLMKYAQAESVDIVSKRIDWANFDAESYSLKTHTSAILCPQDGYMLIMPESWNDTVTARYNDKERTTTVYGFDYVGNNIKLNDEIITIKAYFDEDFDKDSSGYIEFARSGATVYTYSIGKSDSHLAISGDELKTLFTLLNQ